MNDETAIIQVPGAGLTDVSALADEYARATAFATYQEGRRGETLRRQKTDLFAFVRFLASIGAVARDFNHDPAAWESIEERDKAFKLALSQIRDDFYTNLRAWQGIGAGLLVAFVAWQKREGYSIGTINVRLATLKQYCHLAYKADVLSTDAHTHIQGVKGIPLKDAGNIDEKRPITRVGYKKASPVDIPEERLAALKHPATGFLARRDALLMCLLLDHGLRVGEIVRLKRNQIALRSRLLTYHRPKVMLKETDLQTDRLTDDTLAAARAYLATLPAKQESLFDLAIISIQERVRVLGELAGIHGLSPHDCRHSWATRAARHGTPLERLKQAGGWSNIQTPLRYIKDSAIANEGVILE